MRWGEIDRDEWEAHAASAPLQQTWLWGDVLAQTGATVERRATRDDAGTLLGLAQVATRRIGPLRVSLLSRGPLWLRPAPVPSLRGLAASLGHPLLLVTPEAGRPARAIPLVTPAWHAELDISAPPDVLRRRLDPSLRNKIARAERQGLAVHRDDTAPAWLLEAEAGQQRARRYRNWPPGLVNLWHTSGGAVRVYVAGDRLAAMLFLLHGRVATYHVGWTGPEGRQAAAHPLCLWRAITELHAAGIRRIDLGTVNTEDAPGLARFKIATGAAVRPLGPTCLILP